MIRRVCNAAIEQRAVIVSQPVKARCVVQVNHRPAFRQAQSAHGLSLPHSKPVHSAFICAFVFIPISSLIRSISRAWQGLGSERVGKFGFHFGKVRRRHVIRLVLFNARRVQILEAGAGMA